MLMQYNNLDYVSVSDENAYAAKAVPVLDINTIYDQSVNTHFSFCVVFPFPIIIMLTVVCFKGACLQGLFPLRQFPLCQFPLRQFPFHQLPTLSIPILLIPIWSMLTKWELTKWELTKWEVDKVGRFTI